MRKNKKVLDRLLDAAYQEAVNNAKNEALVRADKMCVVVQIPPRFSIVDVEAAEARMIARARGNIKKVRGVGILNSSWKRVVEPYQQIMPEGPNYRSPTS